MTAIRRGEAGDLAAIDAIQQASPETPRWNPSDYLEYDLLVAVCGNHLVGFLASRKLAGGELEILNLAVAPDFRRRGIARSLWRNLLDSFSGSIFLEVRESNQPARTLYQSLGFQEVGRRPAYYGPPPETAIVMKFHSC
jgi:ribosomal-protein-alanine N-acetyltransferase